MSFPSHPRRIDHSKYIRQREQVMNLLIMQPSTPSHHFIPLASNCFSTLFSHTLILCKKVK
jgi:hypothetical protein